MLASLGDTGCVCLCVCVWIPLPRRYKAVSCPILILRGERSDVLPTVLGWQMMKANRNASLTVLPHCGHAPALNTRHQIVTVTKFVTQT